MTRGVWCDRWTPLENFNINDVIEEIEVDKDSFYDEAYSKFTKLTSRRINIETEPPLKLKIFYNKENGKKLLIFCVHHSLADGRGGSELIELIGKHYDAILNNKVYESQKNYHKISKLIFSMNLIETIISSFDLVQSFLMTTVKPLIELDKVKTKVDAGSVERIFLSKEELIKLKAYYKDFNFTVNDIILQIALKLSVNYNMKLKKPASHVAVSMSMDFRRYFKEKFLSVANFSGFGIFIVNNKDVSDLHKLSKKFKAFTKKPIGVGFLSQILLLDITPSAFQKKVIVKMMEKLMVKGGCSSMITTNAGKLDKYVTSFGDIIENISFIGAEPMYGFPSVSASGYKDTLSIYFTKYNDENNITKKVRDDFNELLNEIIAKDQIK